MSLKTFLTSKTFLIQLGIAALVTLLLLIIVLVAVRSYTDHGESFAVPDFQGMNTVQVEDLIREKNLHYEIMDSLYTENAAPGTVIDQFPVPGFAVKKGRTVFLTICSKSPEQVAMPALTDVSLRQAVNMMQGVGLNVGKVEYIPSEYPNLVLEQKFHGEEILPGKMIDRGSAIDLVVGKSGSGEMTLVPDLRGVSLAQAQNELTIVNLSLGAVIYDESVLNIGDSLSARVWQQRPEASGQVVDQGISVDLWLTADESKLNAGQPDAAGVEPDKGVIEW